MYTVYVYSICKIIYQFYYLFDGFTRKNCGLHWFKPFSRKWMGRWLGIYQSWGMRREKPIIELGHVLNPI